MSLLEDFFKNPQYAYPTDPNPKARMALRNLEYFRNQDQPTVEQQAIPAGQQATPLEMQSPAMNQPSQIQEPYNALERVFLGFGGQGKAVEEDKQRYQLAKMAESIPVDPNDKIGSALKQYALQSPDGAKSYLEYMMANQKQNQKSLEPDVKGEGELRKEFDNLNKDYRVINDAYAKIKKVEKDPSAAGDLSLIFSYMKLLDPGSTVREAEFANAQNAAGVPVMIQNVWNRAKSGERLAPEQRADFLNQAKNLYEAQAQGYSSGVQKYRGLAMDYGYNPDRIVKPLEQPEADPLEQKKAELRAKIDAIKKQKGL